MTVTDKVAEHEAWPARAAGLALLGALLAIAIERIVGDRPHLDDEVWRSSLAAFLAVSGLALAFTLERLRPFWSLVFALIAGATVGLIILWNGNPSGWSAGTEWRMVAAGLVIAIAAPLFQAARDAGRLDLSPTPIQRHAWTNIILWFSAWAFTGLAFLLAQLLAELFLLIGIDLLRDALRKGWFAAAIIGGALGGAIGLLRDRDAMLGQFQRVAVTILSVLAPVLAVGLVLFVAALPFTGLQPLWETTRATTPILLTVIGGAFILASAVLGNAPEEEAKGRALRWSARALGLVIAPLAIVAAVSTWLRINQYGFSPDRLWALVFVAIVLMIAAVYGWIALRARTDIGTRIRPANVRLALALCAIGLLLATPLVDFGALSTRDQLARLASNRVTPEQFDWAALRFDFGPVGRQALEDLRRARAPQVRELAQRAAMIKDRNILAEQSRRSGNAGRLARTLRVTPTPLPLPPALSDAVVRLYNICSVGPCTLHWTPQATEAIVVGFPCENCQAGLTRLAQGADGRWTERSIGLDIVAGRPADPKAQMRAARAGQVEIRTVQRRQAFVGGQPAGPPF